MKNGFTRGKKGFCPSYSRFIKERNWVFSSFKKNSNSDIVGKIGSHMYLIMSSHSYAARISQIGGNFAGIWMAFFLWNFSTLVTYYIRGEEETTFYCWQLLERPKLETLTLNQMIIWGENGIFFNRLVSEIKKIRQIMWSLGKLNSRLLTRSSMWWSEFSSQMQGCFTKDRHKKIWFPN